MTVTFSETVEVEGTPRLIELGGGSRTATIRVVQERRLWYSNTRWPRGKATRTGWASRPTACRAGPSGTRPATCAKLDHDGVAADSGHKVDGVKPELAASGGAVVDGTTLTLTYGAAGQELNA